MTATEPLRTAVVWPDNDASATGFVRGVALTPGTAVSIAGKRGRFRFVRAGWQENLVGLGLVTLTVPMLALCIIALFALGGAAGIKVSSD